MRKARSDPDCQHGGDDFPAELSKWNPPRFPEPKDWTPRLRPPLEVRESSEYKLLMESNGVQHGRRKVRKGRRRANIRWSNLVRYHRHCPYPAEALLARILWLDRPLLDVERDGIKHAKAGKRDSEGRRRLGEILADSPEVNMAALSELSHIARTSLFRCRKKSATFSRVPRVERKTAPLPDDPKVGQE